MTDRLHINLDRLQRRLAQFNAIGALPGGGTCRLALSDEDRQGRDLLVQWMRELGLSVTIDAIGNIFGVRAGSEDIAPVMVGSHIDTVGTGGKPERRRRGDATAAGIGRFHQRGRLAVFALRDG